METITILIIDDHLLFRDTLSFLINRDSRFSVIAGANNSEEGLALAIEKRPDVILMDINMGPFNGFELTEKLLAHSPLFKIIALSMHAIAGCTYRILKAGAMGYVTKNSGINELFTCITEVYQGNKYVCAEIKEILVRQQIEPEGQGLQALSGREFDIALLIKQGLSSNAIANRLDITTPTVKSHRNSIMRKLNMKNTAALVNYAHAWGL